MKALVVVVVLSGCAGFAGVEMNNDANPGGDAAGSGCQITFGFQPPATPSPHAGPGAVERATATLSNFSGVPTYFWDVKQGGVGVTTTALGDGGAIDFPIETAGVYQINLQVQSDNFGAFCNDSFPLTVVDSGAKITSYRVRVAPPSPTIPTIEQDVQVVGGGDQQINIAYPPLAQVGGTVLYNGSPLLAYVRIAPPGSSAYVETFTDGTGQFAPVSLLTGQEEVLVLPLVAGPAPKLIHWDTSQAPVFLLDDGSPVSGTVTNSAGTGIAGAKVQLLLGGRLPSTIATTLANGSFTLQADTTDPNLVASITASVTPPPASGLPRLALTGAIDLTSTVSVHYNALATRDLANVPVKQGATALANAEVVVVGSVGSAGVVDGAAATDTIHVAAKTSASGAIVGATLAPAKPVSVVVTLASGEVEVVAVDLTNGVPAAITVPAEVVRSGVVTDSTGMPLAGVRVELVPAGPLALAGIAPTQAVTSPTGNYTVHLASAGTYDLRVVDPGGRGPLFTKTAAPPAQIGDVQLAAALHVTGVVTLPDLSAVSNASVQFLCTGCTGLDGLRAVAESSTDIGGNYRVGVPDPGVN